MIDHLWQSLRAVLVIRRLSRREKHSSKGLRLIWMGHQVHRLNTLIRWDIKNPLPTTDLKIPFRSSSCLLRTFQTMQIEDFSCALGMGGHHVESYQDRQRGGAGWTLDSPEPALNQLHCPSLMDEVQAIESLEPSVCLISTLIS